MAESKDHFFVANQCHLSGFNFCVDKFSELIEEQTSECLPTAMLKVSHPDEPERGFKLVPSFIDSASSLALIPLSFLNQLRSLNIIPKNLTRALREPKSLLLGDNKNRLTVTEGTPLLIEYEGRSHIIAFGTIPSGNKIILGNGAIWRLKCRTLPPAKYVRQEEPKCLTFFDLCEGPNDSVSKVSMSDNFSVTDPIGRVPDLSNGTAGALESVQNKPCFITGDVVNCVKKADDSAICASPNESAPMVGVSDTFLLAKSIGFSASDLSDRSAESLDNVKEMIGFEKDNLALVEKVKCSEDSFRLMIRHPALEVALANPKHRRGSRKSQTYNLILTLRLRELMERGVCERTSLKNLVFTSQLCLVDKRQKGTKPTVWDPENPNLHSDIRVVMNSAAANKMILHRDNSGNVFLSSPSEIHDEIKTQYTEMYQTTAIESLRLIPAKPKMLYAKVDLKNGYESVEIHEGLRRFFGAEVFDEIDKQWMYYQWKTVVQGNKWSSLYFRLAVHEVISEVLKDVRIQSYICEGDIVYFFLQDDIGMGGSNFDNCSRALTVLLEYLARYSLKSNPKKLVYPCDSITFCGYTVSSKGIVPTPTRTPVTEAFAEEAWLKFCNLKTQRKTLHWLKSIAGTFQFFTGFLIADQYVCLRQFYDLISTLQKDAKLLPTKEEKEVIKKALFDLADYVVNKLPALTLSNFPYEDIVCSFIIVDANADAWSGILFRMVKLNEEPYECAIQDLDLFQPVIEALRKENKVVIPERFMLVPAQLTGDAWHDPVDMRRSSTMRERISQFEVIERMIPLLKGPVFVVSDCSNAGWDPKDFTEQLTGTLIPKWQRYNQEVTGTIWLPRDSLPSVVDCIARIYAQQHRSQMDNDFVGNKDDIESTKDRLMVTDQQPVVHDQATAGTILRQPEQYIDAIKNDIMLGYREDDNSLYKKVKMKDVYLFLTNGLTQASDQLRNLAKRFHVRDELLYFTMNSRERIYIPRGLSTNVFYELPNSIQMRLAILHIAHTSHGVHVGTDRMQQRLFQRYWWPNQHADCVQFIASCPICAKMKARHITTGGTLGTMTDQASEIFEVWMVDHAGPFVVNGVKAYVLLVICCFSRFLIPIFVPDLSAKSYCEALIYHVILDYGIPRRIHSDLGSAFTAEISHQMGQEIGINMTHGLAYHPRGQGLVEKAVDEVKTSLRTCLAQRPDLSFLKALKTIQAVHNQSEHRALKVSPFQVVYGRSPTALSSIILPGIPHNPDLSTSRYQMQKFYRESLGIMQRTYIQEMKDKYEAKSSASRLRPGIFVFRVLPAIMDRGTITGPHLVIRRNTHNSWIIGPDHNQITRDLIVAPQIQLHPIEPTQVPEDFPSHT